MKKIVILISGRGSNMQAIVNAKMPHNICCVLSNNPDAEGLNFARDKGIDTCVVNHRDYPDRDSFDQALGDVIDMYKPDLIVLAGFMRILTSNLVERFAERIIIHDNVVKFYVESNTS